ncbi:E3 ubiquitin-protein ligase rnf8 [Cichlidogyrus casuarinus]|uniref:E3 ubiquitin-protein ligase rnf8 n=1 Tax=Cichlidogyrus casuarinus TaxID=1844966 RepID=A0ABD2QE78_9PLAT
MFRFLKGLSGLDPRHSTSMMDSSMQTASIPIVIDAHSSTNSLTSTPVEECVFPAELISQVLEEDLHSSLESDLSIQQSLHLDKLVKDQFVCPICRNLLAKVHSLNCGHNFCYSCISGWKNHSVKCPMCRENIKCVAPSNNTDQFLQNIVLSYGSDGMKRSYQIRVFEANEAMRKARESQAEDEASLTAARYVQTYSFYINDESGNI